MKINDINKIARKPNIYTGDTNLSDFGCAIRKSGGDQHCFYCNYSLECGQKECIWREDCV